MILSAIAAKRTAQHSAITMILTTLSANGCLAFLDFLLITILQWLIDGKCSTCHYMAMQQIQVRV